jgi:xanthine dehydrogenase accessory factor
LVTGTSLFSRLKDYLKQDKSVALAVVVRGPADLLGRKALIPAEGEPAGPLLETAWRGAILQDAFHLMDQRRSATRRYPLDMSQTAEVGAGLRPAPTSPAPTGGAAAQDELEIFFDVNPAAPRLVIVGAVHIASELIFFARHLGFRTYLVDPRTAFATAERFPHVDTMITRWPDEALPEIGLTRETSVVVVTHDPKLDDPALMLALPSPAGYVGALGSPNTPAKRVKRLLAAGLSQAQLDRLHAPIGLEIGARTPAEIALSIMAEIVSARNS